MLALFERITWLHAVLCQQLLLLEVVSMHAYSLLHSSHAVLLADPNVHALLWMAEAVVDIIGMGIGIEAAKHAINYFFSLGASSQKKKSS